MFKPETIRNYVEKMNEMIEYFMSLSDEELGKYHVIWSKGNGKVPTWNVSLPPIISCPNCKHCKGECYDIKACLRFATAKELGGKSDGTMRARALNWVILKRDPDRYWSEVRAKIRRIRKGEVRFHQGGDQPSKEYFAELVETCKMFPNKKVWTYVKTYGYVNNYVATHGGSREVAIPSNLSIMFSEWKVQKEDGTWFIVPFPNPYNFPTYSVQFGDEEMHGWHCPGKCAICIELGRGCVVGESSWIHVH